MKILSDSASAISGWRRTDDKGNVWFPVTEKAFKDELDIINKTLLRGLNPNRQTMQDGTIWEKQADGTFLQIE